MYAFIFKDYIYLILERGEGREKEREKNIDRGEKRQLPLSRALTGNRTRTPGMCPDPFTVRDDTQPAKPLGSGLCAGV